MIGIVNVPGASLSDLSFHSSNDITSGVHGLKYNTTSGKFQRLVNGSYQDINIGGGSGGIPINDTDNNTSYTASINIVNGKPVLVISN